MKVIKFDELHKYDYNIDIVDFKLHYNPGATYNCTADGRPNNGILYYADIETIHTFPDKIHHFKKDDFVYFPMGAKFSSVFATESETPTEINSVHLAFLLKDSNGEYFKLSDDVMNLTEKSNKNYKDKLFEIAYLISLKKPPMYVKAKFIELLTDISVDLSEKNESPEYQQIIESIRYIEENLDKKISVKDAAEASFLSESHFRMLFTKHFKIPPAKYINQLKIKKATTLLKSGLYSIVEVSKMIGIDSPAYFSWFYKKHTNQNPSDVLNHKNKK